jgi:hypothetical protein
MYFYVKYLILAVGIVEWYVTSTRNLYDNETT